MIPISGAAPQETFAVGKTTRTRRSSGVLGRLGEEVAITPRNFDGEGRHHLAQGGVKRENLAVGVSSSSWYLLMILGFTRNPSS